MSKNERFTPVSSATDGAAKLLRELQCEPELYLRVLARIYPHIKAMREYGEKIPLEQVLREAIELEKRGDKDDRWTPENRGDGLQIVSYDIYRQPSPL